MRQNNNLNSQWVALILAQLSKSKQKTFPLNKATKSYALNLNFVNPTKSDGLALVYFPSHLAQSCCFSKMADPETGLWPETFNFTRLRSNIGC